MAPMAQLGGGAVAAAVFGALTAYGARLKIRARELDRSQALLRPVL